MKARIIEFAKYYGQKVVVAEDFEMGKSKIPKGSTRVLDSAMLALIEDELIEVKLVLKELGDILNDDCVSFANSFPELWKEKDTDLDKIAYTKSTISTFIKQNIDITYDEADTLRSLGYVIGISKDLYVVKEKLRCSQCKRPTYEKKCNECLIINN